MPQAHPRVGGILDWRLAVLLVACVHLVLATGSVLFGALNPDEGFYAVATRAVAQGELPYRDFGFTQPPLTLYLNALPLRLAGFGLFTQRALNGLWAFAAIAVAGAIVARRTALGWGLLFVLAFSLSAPWMYFIHLGKTYGATTGLVMLTTWVFLQMPANARRGALVGLLSALGVATRLPAAPFFAVLWLATAWPAREDRWRCALAVTAGTALGGVIALAPFALFERENARFWVFDFHGISVPRKEWHLAWQEILTLAPALWLLALAALGLALWQRRIFSREGAVLLAAGSAVAANLLPAGVYEEYAVPFLPPLLLASVVLLHESPLRHLGPRAIAGMLVLLASVHFGTAPSLLREAFPERRNSLSALLTPNAPRYNPELPREYFAACRLVEQSLPKDAPLIGPNLILAAATGRAVPRELRMGSFAYTADFPEEHAQRLHLATGADLERWFAAPTPMVALFRTKELNYGWSMPSFTPTADDVRARWLTILQRDYTVGLTAGQFVVLLRRTEVDAPTSAPKPALRLP